MYLLQRQYNVIYRVNTLLFMVLVTLVDHDIFILVGYSEFSNIYNAFLPLKNPFSTSSYALSKQLWIYYFLKFKQKSQLLLL